MSNVTRAIEAGYRPSFSPSPEQRDAALEAVRGIVDSTGGDMPLHEAPKAFWDAVPDKHLPALCALAVEGKRREGGGPDPETWEMAADFSLMKGEAGVLWLSVAPFSGGLPIAGTIGLELRPGASAEDAGEIERLLNEMVACVTFMEDRSDQPLGRGEAGDLLREIMGEDA